MLYTYWNRETLDFLTVARPIIGTHLVLVKVTRA